MKLIGITGAIGHGKSALAACLLQQDATAVHDESANIISSFATEAKLTLPSSNDLHLINTWLNSLGPLIQKHLHLAVADESLTITQEQVRSHPTDFEKLFDYITTLAQQEPLRSQIITEQTKPQHRSILQWFGGFLVQRITPTIWFDELIRRSEKAAQAGCQHYIIGGLRFASDAEVIHAHGGIVIEIERPDMPESELQDPTERDRKNIAYDTVVTNNGTTDELCTVATDILRDLDRDQLKEHYFAKI